MKRIKTVSLCICAALLVGGASVFCTVRANALTTDKLSVMEEEARVERVKQLEFDELVGLINGDTSVRSNDLSYANDGLYAVGAQLLEQKDALSNEQLMDEITDSSNQIQTRCILMDLYSTKNKSSSKTELKQMLVADDGSLPVEMKLKAIVDVEFTASDVPLLKSYVDGADELVAFHGLKQLAKVDMAQALTASDEILRAYTSEPSQKVSAAQAAKSKYYQLNPSAQGKAEFISLCTRIVAANPEDEVLRDSSTFALSALRDYSAVQAVVHDQNLDRISKVAAVNENFMTLWDVLKGSPTQANIMFVVECMELHPVKDLADDLQGALETLGDPLLKARGLAAVEQMRGPEGIPANYKWIS